MAPAPSRHAIARSEARQLVNGEHLPSPTPAIHELDHAEALANLIHSEAGPAVLRSELVHHLERGLVSREQCDCDRDSAGGDLAQQLMQAFVGAPNVAPNAMPAVTGSARESVAH